MRPIMQIRPVRNDKDHRTALAEIEKLWRAPVGTPEGDKLDVLVTLARTSVHDRQIRRVKIILAGNPDQREQPVPPGIGEGISCSIGSAVSVTGQTVGERAARRNWFQTAVHRRADPCCLVYADRGSRR